MKQFSLPFTTLSCHVRMTFHYYISSNLFSHNTVLMDWENIMWRGVIGTLKWSQNHFANTKLLLAKKYLNWTRSYTAFTSPSQKRAEKLWLIWKHHKIFAYPSHIRYLQNNPWSLTRPGNQSLRIRQKTTTFTVSLKLNNDHSNTKIIETLLKSSHTFTWDSKWSSHFLITEFFKPSILQELNLPG